MSNASPRSSTPTNRPLAESPSRAGGFPPEILERAAGLAARYRILLERADGAVLARGVEMPTICTSAPSADECEAKLREMLTLGVAAMLEGGQSPPLPAAERRAQLNLRLSEEEKLILESAAQRLGFRGVSEYVRFAALSHARSGRV